jgi:hypothetical protein
MVKRSIALVALALLHVVAARAIGLTHGMPKNDPDAYPIWRAAAARTLAARHDAGSLATAAALTFLGPPSRSKADLGKAASAALELAVKASELAPSDSAISWLRLQMCTNAPGCDIRQAATTMRWVAADNGVAWLPTVANGQKDKDAMEIDRAIDGMAQGEHFDLYGHRATVMMYDALRRARKDLPPDYLKSDSARLTEALGIANAAVVPSFSPLINACREAAPGSDRRAACLTLSKTLQHADAVMAQLVGFAIEKRLSPADSPRVRTLSERRRLLEWRVAAANQADSQVLPWLANAHARARVAKMRAMPREEDVCVAILKEHKKALEPPEDRR